jgi:hypothetical protein
MPIIKPITAWAVVSESFNDFLCDIPDGKYVHAIFPKKKEAQQHALMRWSQIDRPKPHVVKIKISVWK